jgi:hypothetical protein
MLCRAIWSWSEINLFVGNMKTVIDVISVDQSEKSLSASYTASLESEHMTAILCRFSLHLHKVGHLAGTSSHYRGGWSRRSNQMPCTGGRSHTSPFRVAHQSCRPLPSAFHVQDEWSRSYAAPHNQWISSWRCSNGTLCKLMIRCHWCE